MQHVSRPVVPVHVVGRDWMRKWVMVGREEEEYIGVQIANGAGEEILVEKACLDGGQ